MLRKIELTLCIVLYWMTIPFAWIITKLMTKLARLKIHEGMTEEEFVEVCAEYLEELERKD